MQPRPKLGRWATELDGLLEGNAAKSAREQLTLIRIFEELRGRGYDGGYDAVRRYARRWSQQRGQSTAAAYVPLSFAPGEARRQTVDPFGTIKSWMGATHFQMKTLKHVGTEMALHILAYHMKRVMRILGVGRLMEAIRA